MISECFLHLSIEATASSLDCFLAHLSLLQMSHAACVASPHRTTPSSLVSVKLKVATEDDMRGSAGTAFNGTITIKYVIDEPLFAFIL